MKKIVITGPESSGKSTLTGELANHFQVNSVREYAREYLEQVGRPYAETDLVHIAIGQVKLEQQAEILGGEYLFYDTDLLTLEIWSDFKYDRCDLWILEEFKKRPKDFYLLCKPDLTWVPDLLRENPDDLEEIYQHYISYLRHHNLPFAIIEGLGKSRLQNAIQIIENQFQPKS